MERCTLTAMRMRVRTFTPSRVKLGQRKFLSEVNTGSVIHLIINCSGIVSLKGFWETLYINGFDNFTLFSILEMSIRFCQDFKLYRVLQ